MKTLIFILLFLGSFIVLTTVTQYLFCPVYSFPEAVPFSGDSLYNPYVSIKKNEWIKCNFHAHARCWNGITNGNATANDIHHVYTGLQYGVAAVSNYQLIDTTFSKQSNYVSAYEHGCNVLKNHQLVLGARRVSWKDYYLPETVSNKQDILNRLSEADTNSLYIINHPMLRGGYSASDFAKLTNYPCMEVLNPACNSSVLWDAALTAGRPVFIVGNDDSHNVLDSTKTGLICTWINVPRINQANILQALRTGSSFAMTIGERLRSQVRSGNSDSMPALKDFSVIGRQIEAKFSLPAKEIQVIGINGKILSTVYNTDISSYAFDEQDEYARITADYGNGTKLFLNPVFRYVKQPLKQAPANINANQTLFLRTIGVVALLFWFTLVLKMAFPRKCKAIVANILNKNKYGNRPDNAYSKSFKIRHRRLVRYVHRLFGYLGLQRKNRFE